MEILDCACGQDHEKMPMVDASVCFCSISYDPKCTHEVLMVEGVCREHKRHIPCRPCMRRDLDSQPRVG